MKEKKFNWQAIIRLLISLILIGAIILLAYLILRHFGLTSLTSEQIQEIVGKTGFWGPFVFVLISFLQVTFIPIPSTITVLAGNFMFGPWISILYSFIGCFLGSLLAFKLGRILGRPFVNWVVGDKETVNKYLDKVKGKELVVFFFMFLLPAFPDDALCSLAGITKLQWKEFILMQVIARPTGIFATVFLMSGEIIPYHGWGLIVLGLFAVLGVTAFIICYKNADKINGLLNRFFNYLSGLIFKKKGD